MDILLIAGPCAIESRDQAMSIAESVCKSGADIFRGGIYKPRSNPYSFQGLADEGVPILQEIQTIMPVISEATQVENVNTVASCADIIQVGSRNMHNIELLRRVAMTRKPIMLKRGYAAMIEEEWITSAEYIKLAGNDQILMCERGIRTFEPYTRNTLDLSAIGAIKRLTDYKIIVDPSHAAGRPELVIPFACAAIAAGADGIMIEVHHDPKNAKCDGHQAITLQEFSDGVQIMRKVAKAVGRRLGYVD